MKFAGSDSWEINVREWDGQFDTALWIRAAERIEVPAAGVVTMPLDLEELPERSVPTGAVSAGLAEGWLHLWNALVFRPPLTEQNVRAEMARFGPPDFEAVAGFPDFRRVLAARWAEAHAWHSARKKRGLEPLRDLSDAGRRRDAEGGAVRAVEAEIGRRAAPFRLRIIVLPVAEDLVRPTGDGTYLVPERFRRTPEYEAWLVEVVRTLA